MDDTRANALASKLVGSTLAGWSVKSLIDNGKSAAVFYAERDGYLAALKVFDREIITRFGGGTQLARIERELEIRESPHPNVVKILDGGYDKPGDLYYVAMEYLPYENLSKKVSGFDPKMIPSLVNQLAAAARHLENLGLVHRDIKPSNIIWQSDNSLKLLDLGVIGPIGHIGEITDVNAREFIGTLQYSSPEYLLRLERDTVDDWRAISFYQIGAVMHDLIMGKQLFQEFFTPYGRMVNAVQHEQPLIQNAAVPSHIVDLARKCLVKDPKMRLNLVTWADFEGLEKEMRSSAKERVTNRLILSAASEGAVALVDPERQRATLAAQLGAHLRASIRAIRSDSSVFPAIHVIPGDQQLTVRFAASDAHRLPNGLVVIVGWHVLDPAESIIEVTGRSDPSDGAAHATVYFRGVMDKVAVYVALEELVYTMLDAAQSISIE